MAKYSPDPRQLQALHSQLNMLENMLRPSGHQPPPNNVVPMPQRQAPQNPMQQQMLENMLGGMDPQRAAQIRALMTVASRPNVAPHEMEAAVGPLMGHLAPQDQATVRMMMSMMNQGQQTPQAPMPAAPAPTPAPHSVTVPSDMQQMLDAANSRAATALEEARRVAAELVNLKDAQNQTTAAMHQ